MANKRNRQKQRNSSKTLEGYERHLLQQLEGWKGVSRTAKVTFQRREANENVDYYKRAHEDLRKYYFDL